MSTRPTSIPSTLPIPLPSALRTAIFSALLATPSSIPTIQRTFSSALDSSGWTRRANERILELLRTGQCATFDEVMERVLVESGRGGSDKGGARLRLPERAVEEGIKAVRAELERADVRVKKDGDEDEDE